MFAGRAVALVITASLAVAGLTTAYDAKPAASPYNSLGEPEPARDSLGAKYVPKGYARDAGVTVDPAHHREPGRVRQELMVGKRQDAHRHATSCTSPLSAEV